MPPLSPSLGGQVSGGSSGSSSITVGSGGSYSSHSFGLSPFLSTPPGGSSPLAPAPTITPVSPTIDPKIEANTLYGKPIILSALGFAGIGATGAPLVGPYINAGKVDFIVSFGFAVPITGNRKIYAIYLDNELAWSSATGWDGSGALPGDSAFAAETFSMEFRPGTLTQAVCSLETTHFPGAENAYRPEMVLQITGLPYARFMANSGKPVPYVSADIGDVTDGADPFDGINLGLALERIAHSPWPKYTSDTFEAVGITDVVGGIILAQNFTVIQICQSITNYYRNLHLLQSDKLRIKDHGSNVSPDFTFTRDTITGAVGITRTGASSEPRESELITIDPDQDYTRVPSIARRPREPVAVSASVGKASGTLPVIINADTRQALVTFAQYDKENARKRLSVTTTIAGYQVEPGDRIAATDLGDGVASSVVLVEETSHNGDFTVTIEGREILRCGLNYNPVAAFLAHYEDGSAASAYTFTSSVLGAAADDRLIVVVARLMRSQSVGRDITSVVLGGNAMELVPDAYVVAGDIAPSANPSVTQGIYCLHVPAGTAATIVVNSGGNAAGASIDIYRLTGLASLMPVDGANANTQGSDPATAINVSFNGILIASYAGVGGTPGTAVWTGINTINVNEAQEPATWWGSGGMQTGLLAEVGRPVSVTAPATGYESVVAAAFG